MRSCDEDEKPSSRRDFRDIVVCGRRSTGSRRSRQFTWGWRAKCQPRAKPQSLDESQPPFGFSAKQQTVESPVGLTPQFPTIDLETFRITSFVVTTYDTPQHEAAHQLATKHFETKYRQPPVDG